MSSKVERERRKAQLLSQIQQQRLDLSASRREWLEATGRLRSSLEYAAKSALLGAGWQ
ncbi:hypothetical protein VEE68_26660 [Escherichia coli]|nr:hypothetical protein VEE68_26660 [Escherichia coli]